MVLTLQEVRIKLLSDAFITTVNRPATYLEVNIILHVIHPLNLINIQVKGKEKINIVGIKHQCHRKCS